MNPIHSNHARIPETRHEANPTGGHAPGRLHAWIRNAVAATLPALKRLGAAGLGLALASAAVAAEGSDTASYPNKPVRVIVAYAPGGANDIVARVYADALGQHLGQPFVVENRSGASGITGTEAAARAPADGYTLLLGAGGTMTINPGLFQKLPYDPLTSFEPVGMLASAPLVLVVPPSLPVKSVQELLDHARKAPQGITFASPGAGTPLHLAGELFARSSNLQVTHIPYRGSTPALTNLIAGRVDMMFDVVGSSMQFIQDQRLRPLAVSSAQRSRYLPDVPTVQEQGIPDFDVTSWFAFFAPAGTPAPIVEKLNQAISQIAQSDAIRDRLAPLGMEPASSTPAQLREMVRAEKDKWARVIAEAKVTVN